MAYGTYTSDMLEQPGFTWPPRPTAEGQWVVCQTRTDGKRGVVRHYADTEQAAQALYRSLVPDTPEESHT